MKIKKEITTAEKIERNLFSDPGQQLILTPKEQEIQSRYKAIFTLWLNKPEMRESEIVKWVKKSYNLGDTSALRDVTNVKLILGNVRNASKEWQRYMVIDMLKRAFEIAKAQKDPKAMAIAADKLGKYTKLDQDEGEPMPWDQIIPPTFEPTGNIEVLDASLVDSDIEEKRAKLRAKFNSITG